MTRRSLKTLTALASSLVLGSTALAQDRPSSTQAGTPDALAAIFTHPPVAARPIMRWWWPGGDVSDEGIRREIDAFEAAGFGGIEIQPFDEGMGPVSAAERQKINDFATPSFFHHLGVAARAAKSHGAFVDYTFGSGWPSGGAFITPEQASLELRSSVRSITGPRAHVRLDIPSRGGFYGAGPEKPEQPLPAGWDARVRAREKIVAVIAWPGTAPKIEHSKGFFGQPVTATVAPGMLRGKPVDLTNRLNADGTLDWDVPAGTWQVFVFRQMPTLQRVTGGVGGGAQLVLDHFSKSAFDAYARHILPPELPGPEDGLRAVFVDSLEVRVANWWSEDFLAQFHKRHGYDLRMYLPFIEQVGWPSPMGNTVSYDDGAMAERVRRDYRQTVKALIRERFFEPFEQAVHSRGLLTRLQAHGAPGDLLTLYGEADIPETEDLFEGISPNFLKMASSAAAIYGKPVTGAEAFIISGTDGYGTTPEQIKRRADALLVNGANALVAHGAPYPFHTDQRPYGWYPWGGVFSSMLGTRNPLLPYLAPVNAYITRLQAIFQKTATIAPVAIYRESGPYPDARPSGGPADTPEPATNHVLRHAGYDFEHLDRHALQASRIEGGSVVTPGTARFAAVVVPDPQALVAQDLTQLERARAKGVPIWIIAPSPPPQGGAQSGRWTTLLRAGAVRLDDAAALPSALRKADIAPVVDFGRSTPVPFLAKRLGRTGSLVFVTNPHDDPRDIEISVPDGQSVERWDAWTGTIAPATTQKEQGHRVYRVHLAAGQSALVAMQPATNPAARHPQHLAGLSLRHSDTGRPAKILSRIQSWSVQLRGYDETGAAVHHEAKDSVLSDWNTWAAHRAVSGSALYTTTFAMPRDLPDGQVVLDLGKVADAARVTVNGCTVIAPYSPFTISLSGMTHPGTNRLEVEVANTPLNATRNNPGGIGAGPKKPPVQPSGLLGPVVLRSGGEAARWAPTVHCTAK